MIFFRSIKCRRRLDLRHDRSRETAALVQIRLGLFRRRLLLRRVIKNHGPILVADIRTLAIQSCRIVIRPKDIEQFVRNSRSAWIELDFDHFRVARLVAAHIFVGRIFSGPARISNRCRSDTLQLPKSRLHPPKTSRAKCRFLCFHKRTMERLHAPRNHQREFNRGILRLRLAPPTG